MPSPYLCFATPRKLPKARDLPGRVVVLDIAFASEASGGGFGGITGPFLKDVGDRLAAWVDHHDHALHAEYNKDARFFLRSKQEHGACPEMITPELVARAGEVGSIVCHSDFDGLMSAAKWIRGGLEVYPGADADARAIDTRIGTPSANAQRIDRAIRVRIRDAGFCGLLVNHMVGGMKDAGIWRLIDEAGAELDAVEARTREIARRYRVVHLPAPWKSAAGGTASRVAVLRLAEGGKGYDKTQLLLDGQTRAEIALLTDKGNLTLAASFTSGLDFLALFGLSGGMPTLVSVPEARLDQLIAAWGLRPGDLD